MQVTETSSKGLKRELQVNIAAKDLVKKFDERLSTMKDRVQLKGFRAGKVPLAHLRKVYGSSVMAEVLQETVSETSRKAIADRKERPVFEPEIALVDEAPQIDAFMDGKQDLVYNMLFEVLPEVKLADLKKLKVEKPVASVEDKDIQDGIEQIALSRTEFETVTRKAKDGDRVTIDFVGKIDGKPFDGGAGEGSHVVIGAAQFIPGFEEGLVGTKAGEEKTIEANFPENYQAKHLAGKKASFDVKISEVGAPTKPELNDEFAKTLGFDSFAKVEEAVSERLQGELDNMSNQIAKRRLLDALDKAHKIDLPDNLVKQEFEQIWNEVTQRMEQEKKTFESEGLKEDDERKQYEDVAERRVRLGLIISEIGTENKIEVKDEEVQQALMQRASQFPGQEKQFFEYYQKNPSAAAELRAPIYEEKVVNFILELADVSKKDMSAKKLEETRNKLEDD